MTKPIFNKVTKVCSRCIYDENTAGIIFDEEGVCNYCALIESLKKEYQTSTKAGLDKLTKIFNKIKEDGRYKKYDCVVGVSGGTDSCYLLHLAKENGLRPIAVHYDNTWNSGLSSSKSFL